MLHQNNRLTSTQTGCFFIAKKGRYYATCKENRGGGYSTTETFTGEYWIDGKKIYKKVVQIASLPNTATATYAHGISDIDTKWFGNGSRIYIGNNAYLLVYAVGNTTWNIYAYMDNSNIVVVTGSDRSAWSADIVIEYTKTSD